MQPKRVESLSYSGSKKETFDSMYFAGFSKGKVEGEARKFKKGRCINQLKQTNENIT